MSKFHYSVVPLLEALLANGWTISSLTRSADGSRNKVVGRYGTLYIELNAPEHGADRCVIGKDDGFGFSLEEFEVPSVQDLIKATGDDDFWNELVDAAVEP